MCREHFHFQRKLTCFPCSSICSLLFSCIHHLSVNTGSVVHIGARRPLGTQPTFGDGESRRPLWSQDVKTNAAVAVDIWVVDSCGKCNLKTDKEKRNVRGRGARKRVRWEEQETEWCKAVACFCRQQALCVPCCYFKLFFLLCASVSCSPLAVWKGSLWGSVWSRRKPRSGKDCHSNEER